MSGDTIHVTMTVNGRNVARNVESRMLLVDFLRTELNLTGTHVGCAHGVCGACTIKIDGNSSRSCLAFAAQMEGANIETVESLAGDGPLTALQQAFHEHHALQCGFCTSGMLISAGQLLERNASPSDLDIRRALAGNLCRCTGYDKLIKSVLVAAKEMRGA